MSRQSSSFCLYCQLHGLIRSGTEHQWINYLHMTRLQLHLEHRKCICLQSIWLNITNNRNELWKSVSLTSYKKDNFNTFQSSSSLSILAFFCICCVIYTFFWWQFSVRGLNFDKFHDTAPLNSFPLFHYPAWWPVCWETSNTHH